METKTGKLKGDIFCFVYLLERDLLLKEEFAPTWEQILSFQSTGNNKKYFPYNNDGIQVYPFTVKRYF